MKVRFATWLVAGVAAGALMLGGWHELRGQSQSGIAPATVGQMLEEIRRENDALIKRQQVILKQLETLREDARQTRIFAKRS